MGGAALKGDQRLLVESQALPVGTFNSPDYWLPEGGGLLITIDVENINGSTITDVNLMSKQGANYDIIWANAAQAINANGRYQYRIMPGSTKAAGANSYKGVAEDIPPVTGRIQLVVTVAIPTVSVRIQCL